MSTKPSLDTLAERERINVLVQAVTSERPILFSAQMVRALLAGTKTQTRRAVKGWQLEWLLPPINFSPEYVAHPHNHACPYGQPGDRLWVREAWARTTVFPGAEMVVYREGDNRTDYGGPWKPGIHMFRRDSRITLEITGVRVERLQAISHNDAMAEGLAWDDAIHDYSTLWDRINGEGAWAANPWVWVVEFRRCLALQPNVRVNLPATRAPQE
jgi:hypothetical protein